MVKIEIGDFIKSSELCARLPDDREPACHSIANTHFAEILLTHFETVVAGWRYGEISVELLSYR